MQTVAQTPDLQQHPLFLATLGSVAACAQAKMPHETPRLTKAVQLVMEGAVHPSALVQDGWYVASQSGDDDGYEVTGNTCTCEDFQRHSTDANAYFCKHVAGTWLYRRVAERLQVADEALPAEGADVTTDTAFLAAYVVSVHGKAYVQYAGLLRLAHSKGLLSLEARLLSVTDSLAVAEATATFADGKRFVEAGDATPANVSPGVKAHFPRCALTRAKSRCLRDALNISMVAVEELA